ncbi:MAG: hypothetical protein H7Y18_17725 [Clostridiaceae bacterium]|nr:hypothetical protein [Clostridiaceae bacterium]
MVVLTASFTHFAGETFGIKSIKEFNDDRRAAIINEVNSIENIYGLANSGYGSNSYILGGPIKINYNLAIKVKSSRPLYLRGKVLDYYDGTGWSNNSDDYYMFNTTPTSKLVKSEEIEISPQTLVTSTLLAPLNTFSVVSSGSNVMYNNSNIFMVGNKSNVTIPYTVKFALNEDEKLDNDVAYGKDISEKYKKYLQVPNNITPKTYNLVNALLKDCKTNEEKIDKINKYLIENYKYSLQVSNVPKDNEFLDYFLFTEKKGYCTYFATAATIFTRIAGIPARYVEGFSMDNTMDTNGVYLVGNNRAHAWTEILTSPSNDAWRTFDCTPGYLDNNQEHKVIIPSTNSKDIKTKDGETQTKAVKNNRIKKLPIINVSFLFIILCLGIALFLLVLGMFFIRIKRWMKNRNKILGCNGVIPLYYYSKKRLNTIGIRWSATLSDEEGALGLKDEELRIHFINIVKVFYEEYYGDTFDKSFNKLLFYKYLEEYVKKNSGFFKYYYYKIK